MAKMHVALITGVSAFVLSATAAFLGMTEAIAPKAKVSRADWMAAKEDGVALSDLSLPGTHNTVALYGLADLTGQCQSLNLTEQLNAGVRFLDIRLKQKKGELHGVHGIVDERQAFKTTVKALETFLGAHPKETVLVSIKQEADPDRPTMSFEACLKTYLNDIYWYTGSAMPETLGAVRGKAVLLSRYDNPTIGVDLSPAKWKDDATFTIGDFFIQDQYKVSDIEVKKAAIEACFASTAKYRINFLSGYLTSGFPPSYAPSVAKEINPWIEKKLPTVSKKGIVLFDFVTSGLLTSFFAEVAS